MYIIWQVVNSSLMVSADNGTLLTSLTSFGPALIEQFLGMLVLIVSPIVRGFLKCNQFSDMITGL